MTFRDRVREEMKFQGLTAKELAAKADINLNTLNIYIGYRAAMPSAEAALKIARALSVPLEYLLNGETPQKTLDGNSTKQVLQRQIFSMMNSMTEKQLKNFVKVSQLFIDISKR